MAASTITDLALDTDQAKTIGLVAIAAFVVFGVVISLIVSAIVSRIITIVIMLALVGIVWSQRSTIESAAKKCDATVFGVHLTPSNPTVKKKCQQVANR